MSALTPYVVISAAWAALKDRLSEGIRLRKARSASSRVAMPVDGTRLSWPTYCRLDPNGGWPLFESLGYWHRWYGHGQFRLRTGCARGVFTAKTICGYSYAYEVTCYYDFRHDKKLVKAAFPDFIGARMLEPKGERLFAETLNAKYVRPALDDYIVTYADSNLSRQPNCYRLEADQSKLIPCGLWGAKGDDRPLGRVLAAEPRLFGAHIVLMSLRFVDVNTEIIKENYAMIPEHIKRAIESQFEFRKHEQEAICRQYAEFVDLRHRVATQTYKSGGVQLRTTPIDGGMHFSWENTTPSGVVSRILGFRKGGAFSPDPWNEETNGILIVDSFERRGEVIDHGLDAKETYFYTFICKDRRRKLLSREYDSTVYSIARFSARPMATASGGGRSAIDQRSAAFEESERLKIREGLAGLRARSAERHEVLAYRKEEQEQLRRAVRENLLSEEKYEEMRVELDEHVDALLRPK